MSDPLNWPYSHALIKKVTDNEEVYSLKNKSTNLSNKDVSRQSSIASDHQVAYWTRVFVPEEEAENGIGNKPQTIQEEDSENYLLD